MTDLDNINAEFFKPYLTVLKYFRHTGIDIFDERNVMLLKFKYTPVVIIFTLIIGTYGHWRYVVQEVTSGTHLLELAVDLSFCYNAVECSIVYLYLLLIKNKIKCYVMKLEKLWRNDDSLPPKIILLKREQVKHIDLYNVIFCKVVQVFIHLYMATPLLIILVKKIILQRDVPYVTPLKFSFPFDYQDNLVTFVLVYLFDYSTILKMTYTITGSLFFLSVTMNQLRTLFVLLQEDFKEIIKANEIEDIGFKLKSTIQKHLMLSEMLLQLGDAYGAIFAIRVLFLSITICFYGISARINNRLEDLKNFMISVITTINIYHCCKHGQLVTDSALEVATVIYESPWENLSCENKKILLLAILRSQRATYIHSTSFTEISLETFKTIMNTTWSFMSLITNLCEN